MDRSPGPCSLGRLERRRTVGEEVIIVAINEHNKKEDGINVSVMEPTRLSRLHIQETSFAYVERESWRIYMLR